MKTLPKIAILVGIYLYAQNKNKAGNLEMTASGNTPAVESGFLANLFTDNWVTYAGAIMSGASWKINDYDLYANAISNAEQANGIPTNLLARQLFQESRFRADVINGTKRSSAGAIGIAQFMPATASWLNVNPLDPFASIDAAAKYMADLHEQTGDWSLALSSYNWGIGNVKKWITGKIKNMPAETIAYSSEILSDVNIA